MASPVKDAKSKAQVNWPGASIHSRGKGWIKHQHPTDPTRFMLDNQVGNTGWHFGDGPFTEAQEVDTAWVNADPILDAPWQKKMVLADYNAYFGPGTQDFNAGQIIQYVHPDSGEDITFEVQQLQWTNDFDQIEAVADPQQITPTSISDDTITWEDAFGTGLDFQWETQTARLSKRLIIDSLSAIGSPPQFIIDGGNPVLRLQFIFQKSSGVEIWIDGVEWDEKSNNPQSTSGDVEFKLASTGETLWYFKQAWISDENFDVDSPTPVQRFRKVANNLFVEVRVPWSWLETASYPVVIDPTIDPQVGASADDAWENATGGVDITVATPNSDNDDEWHAFRWSSVTISNGVTIDVAYIRVQFFHAAYDEPYLTMDFEDGSAPAQFTTGANNISGRTGTTNTEVFDNSNAGANNWVNSDSVVSIIQELEDSYDYSSGAAMVNRMTPVQPASGARDAGIHHYDSSTSVCPILHIEYEEAGGVQNYQSAAGVLTAVGTIVKSGRKPLAGSLTPVGIIAKKTAKTFTGATTAVGVLVKQAQKAFTGSTTASGVLVGRAGKILTGSITASGTLIKSTAKLFVGSVTAAGALVKKTSKIFTGSLTASGVLSTTKVTLLSIGGSVTAVGSLIKQTGKSFVGSVTAVGSLVKQAGKILLGSLTPSGILATTKVTLLSISGSLTLSGILVRQTGKIVLGSLTPAGTLVKQPAKAFTGVVTAAGSLVKQTAISLVGSVTTVGSLATQKITGGYYQVVGGVLTMSGIVVRQTNKIFTGSLTQVGTLVKQTVKAFTGSITAVGSLATQRSAFQVISGAVTMAGGLVKQTSKQTAGIMTMTGSITKRISKSISGVLTTVGTLVRQIIGLPVPDIRIYAIEAENRVYAIAAETRLYSIESEDRIYPIPG